MASVSPLPNSSRWLGLASAMFSLAMALVIGWTLSQLAWREIVGLVPVSPLFWLAFLAFYFANPLGDWIIFRRLWPKTKGLFGALARKQVYNEIALGYLGEAYLYTWARRHIGDGVFGCVKDVAILSALAGNALTVLLLIFLWPQIGEAFLTSSRQEIFWSLAFVLSISVVVLLAGRRVFSLGRRDNLITFAIHMARNILKVLLAGLMWHLIVPDVQLSWWLALATLRQLVTRLPLISNKDLIFAGLAVLMLPDQPLIAATVALTGALLIAAHVVTGIVLFRTDIGGLLQEWRGSRA